MRENVTSVAASDATETVNKAELLLFIIFATVFTACLLCGSNSAYFDRGP